MLTYSTLVWETISKWIPNNTSSSVLTPYYLPESFGRSWELSGCRKRSHMTGKNCSNNQHSHSKEMVLNSKNNLVCLLKQILRPQSYKFQFSFLVGGGLKQLHFQQAHQKLGCRSVLHSQCRHAGTVVWDSVVCPEQMALRLYRLMRFVLIHIQSFKISWAFLALEVDHSIKFLSRFPKVRGECSKITLAAEMTLN